MDEADQIMDSRIELELVQNKVLRLAIAAKDHQIKLFREKIKCLLCCCLGLKPERLDQRRQLLLEPDIIPPQPSDIYGRDRDFARPESGGQCIYPITHSHVRLEPEHSEEHRRGRRIVVAFRSSVLYGESG